jgi:hypothetical protein
MQQVGEIPDDVLSLERGHARSLEGDRDHASWARNVPFAVVTST